MKKTIPAILFSAALSLSSAAAQAELSFTFAQSGFDEVATLSGSFAGNDTDGNGRLSSFDGEISAYSIIFSGNSIVSAFSHGFADLTGLVYELGSGSIGDAADGLDEGVASNWPPGGSGFTFSAGLAVNGLPGGSVIDNDAGGAMSTTLAPVLVSELNAVPEPGTLALLALPLIPLAATRRRQRQRQADGAGTGRSAVHAPGAC